MLANSFKTNGAVVEKTLAAYLATPMIVWNENLHTDLLPLDC
ncbi:hypothetical protein VCR29J2_700168 [Vibrio coralliirubri]|nr:hypothetical protein VCR29J2_700168 [Vibrio coralliirubri]